MITYEKMSDYVHSGLGVFLLVICFLGCHSRDTGKTSREIHLPFIIDTSSMNITGIDAKLGEFPFQVMIDFDDKGICGGVIINEDWLLSAAHCFDIYVAGEPHNRKGPSIKVFIGSVEYGKTVENRWVSEYIMHQYYSNKTLHYDIALVKLNKQLDFANFSTYKPTQLPVGVKEYVGKSVTLTGWGATSKANVSAVHKDILQKVTIPVVFASDLTIHTNKSYGGACLGDSGGPMTLDETGEVIGIISHTTLGCEGPSVATRIDGLLDWIKNEQSATT